MKASDIFFTVEKDGYSKVTEKMSRFLGYSSHVTSVEEAKEFITSIRNKHCDSRHVCWAYMIGADRQTWQMNDNGEPSGTAGKPILGQINSLELTDVVVAVARYFGGIKLGTSGLISAYRETARLALLDGGKKEMHRKSTLHLTFPYLGMNGVMKILKSESIDILRQTFENTCELDIELRLDLMDKIQGQLRNLDGITIDPIS